MPTTSKKKQKSKSFFQQEKFTAELSSGQLVVGISILILFGLTCFLLGILLGRSEYTRTVEIARIQQPQGPESIGASDGQPGARPINLGNVPPTIHRLPAPQPSESVAEPETDTPSSVTVEASSPTPPIESPSPVEELAITVEAVVPSTVSTPQESAAPESTTTETQEPVVTSLDIATAPYSVQVGAFSKRANAESAKKKIESKTSYPVRLLDVPESKVTIVLAGAFTTLSTAEAARTVLRDKLGYADSYIKKNDQ